MEILILNVIILFIFFWVFQNWRDRKHYKKILEGSESVEDMPVEELVDAFYKSDTKIAEIRQYVKISKEELLSDVRGSLDEHPDQQGLTDHLQDVAENRKKAQTVISSGELELEEMQQMIFFASFLSAKEQILQFIFRQKYRKEPPGAEPSAQDGEATIAQTD